MLSKPKQDVTLLNQQKSISNFSRQAKVIDLAFVDLGQDSHPQTNKSYPLISASDIKMSKIAVPDSIYKRVNVNLFEFYVDNLPDLTKNNEGLFKLATETRNEKNLGGTIGIMHTHSFSAKDRSYAQNFLYHNVLKNVLIEEDLRLEIELIEVDQGVQNGYKNMKQVVDKVPQLKTLDVINGIPYLGLATSLFEGVIDVFGKQTDDLVWGEQPMLSIDPMPGAAFLRSGIYILYERENSKGEAIDISQFVMRNRRLVKSKNSTLKRMPTHLIFGIQIKKFTPKNLA